MYSGNVTPDEVFVSDGSKCDLGRLQWLFDGNAKVAVQDPAYPVYVDSSVMFGRTQEINEETSQYNGLVYMPWYGCGMSQSNICLISRCVANQKTISFLIWNRLRIAT